MSEDRGSVPRAVFDTNVLVSGLINAEGSPALLLNALFYGRIVPVADTRILSEYVEVLLRDKFRFTKSEVHHFFAAFTPLVEQVLPAPLPSGLKLPDPKDGMFVAASLAAGGVPIVTGNARHFPDLSDMGYERPDILSPADMLRKLGLAHR